MKTKAFSIVLILVMTLMCSRVLGGTPEHTMIFYTKSGMIKIPVKVEEAPDSLPQVVKENIMRMKTASLLYRLNFHFDLSTMTKPEEDVDDVTINTRRIFDELRYQDLIRK